MTGILARAWMLVVVVTSFLVLLNKTNLDTLAARLRTGLAVLWTWFGRR